MDRLDSLSGSVCWTIHLTDGPFLGIKIHSDSSYSWNAERVMSEMNRRLKKVEKALNVDEEKRVVEIVVLNDGESPPDRTWGNVALSCIRYGDICK